MIVLKTRQGGAHSKITWSILVFWHCEQLQSLLEGILQYFLCDTCHGRLLDDFYSWRLHNNCCNWRLHDDCYNRRLHDDCCSWRLHDDLCNRRGITFNSDALELGTGNGECPLQFLHLFSPSDIGMPGGASTRLSSFPWHQAREAIRKSVERKKMVAPRLPATALVQSKNKMENDIVRVH